MCVCIFSKCDCLRGKTLDWRTILLSVPAERLMQCSRPGTSKSTLHFNCPCVLASQARYTGEIRACRGSASVQCLPPTCTYRSCVAHHIVGNFCRLLVGARQKMPHPQILQSKLVSLKSFPLDCTILGLPRYQPMNAEAPLPLLYMYSVCDIVNDSHTVGYATIYLDSSSFTKTLN